MKKNKKRILSLFTAAVLVCQLFLSPAVFATKVSVSAGQDDIYDKLEEAAKLNVIMNTFRKCVANGRVPGGSDTMTALYSYEAEDGNIFDYGETNYTTALWLEHEMGADDHWGGSDGQYWCYEGQEEGEGALFRLAKALFGNKLDYDKILCDGGKGRILRTAEYTDGGNGYMGYYPTSTDTDCDSFDEYSMYVLNPNWDAKLEELYNQYKESSGNQYLPAYGSIGSYNNVDGYINYLLDFDFFCDSNKKYKTEPSDTTTYPVTKFDKDDTKITAKTWWYHLKSDDSWDSDGPLSRDNPVTSCSGLLTRIEELRTQFNTVETGYSRDAGYEGIIIQVLKDTCKNLASDATPTVQGSAWTELKAQLEEVINSEDATATEIERAQANLEIVDNAIRTNYYLTVTGDEADEDGKIYQCLDVEGLRVHLNDYDYGSEDDGEGTDEGAEADCYTNAGSLGWVLCPIIDQGSDFIAEIYEKFIEPFLVLDSGLFKLGEEGGEATFEAWMQFQGYANIVFIILFLFVIFSQLTGVGIDNYGIKKILPKLIVAAILINASYIICQLAVDIANIIGYGIKSALDNIGLISDWSGVHLAENPDGGLKNGFTATSILVVLVGLLVAPAILSQGSAILVPIFIAIIGIVVAIFTLFCLLAVRKAMAVVLVILSPLAFVCYMLPNTKKLYDRWLTTFKGVLLAFPICSLMVYGGQAVARIIVHACGSSNMPSLLALSAAVMSVAPIFLIPGVLKKSMGAVSAFVAKATGGIGNFAKGRAMGSRAATYLRHQGDQRRIARQNEFNARRATGTMNRMNKRMERSGKTLADMGASKQRAYMSAAGMVAGHDAERQKAYSMSFDNMSPEQVASSFQRMITDGKYDKNLAAAAVQNLSDANKHDVLNNMLTGLGDDYMKNMSDTDRVALGKQLSGLKGTNAMAGMYGKSLMKGGNSGFSSYMGGGGFAKDIKDAGKNIMSTQDDSALKFMADNMKSFNGANFTDEQLRNSVGNLDTKQQNEANRIWGNMSAGDKESVFSGMSTEQYAKVDTNLATAVGNGNLEAGRNLINGATTAQRQALMGEEGATIRAGQNSSQQAMNSWSSASATEKQNAANAFWDTLDNLTQKQIIKDAVKAHPPANGTPDAAYFERVKLDHLTSDPSRITGAGYRV